MKKHSLEYIRTRLVKKQSQIAFQEGAQKAMAVNGYVVIAQQGWIVKKYSDGKIEKIKEIDTNNVFSTVILD
jgi:hypothetical protein